MEPSPCQLQCVSVLLFASFVVSSGSNYTNNAKPHFIDLDDILRMPLPDMARTVSKPKPLVHAYSKELIRLRGNDRSLNSGLIEVYRGGQWGYVCDDRWDLKDASVACKQLGFTLGAVSASDRNSLSELQRSSASILMDDVQCFGNESNLHECPYNAVNDCTFAEIAGIICHANEGCPKGWISGFGKCYTFYGKAKTIQLAANVCARDNASLVTIDSVHENHYLSNIIKNSVAYIHQWYTGGKKNKNKWLWKKSTVAIDRWFPGWPSFNNKYSEPADAKGLDCLTLSDEYNDPTTDFPVVGDYFYWKADKCRNDEGINFICQKNVDRQEKVSNQDCYNDNGTSYRGNVEFTESGYHCLKWSSSFKINDTTHPGKGLGDHNFCRNPDGDKKPWCWISHVLRKFGFCEISKCSEVEVTTAAPTGLSALSPPTCTAREFYCSSQKICIPEDFHCDNEKDCKDGEDEVDCDYTLNNFHKTADSVLGVYYNRVLVETESYKDISDETCAKMCVQNRIFVCKSFIYDHLGRTCELSNLNSSSAFARMEPSLVYDYYELKLEVCEVEQFKCKNDLCVSAQELCDNNDDCGDNSDEYYCQSVSFHLVNGSTPSEGRVEVTRNGFRGTVCDDDWDDKDAAVVCRKLGFVYGGQALNNGFFGQGTGPIWLDDVNCSGTEVSLEHCSHQGWAKHDCIHKEDAGVKCFDRPTRQTPLTTMRTTRTTTITTQMTPNTSRTPSTVCEMDQFKCKNDLCVSAKDLCDSIDDCGDNSDEYYCQSVGFQLVNGSTPSEGRVEVTRNGFRGTVCDDGWDDKDAAVVCRKLGFMYGGQALIGAFFGRGSGPIWLDNVNCSGTEASLEQCPHRGWAEHSCGHGEDAGVKCRIPGTDVIYQLVNGSTPCEGRVEVIRNGSRGTVCDDDWDNKDAAVVCRKLGFMYGGQALIGAFFGPGTGQIWLDNVNCSGTEASLEHCPHRGWAIHNCGHGEDAGVKCRTPRTVCEVEQFKCKNDLCVSAQEVCDNNDDCWDNSDESFCQSVNFHLVNGSTPSEGRVEVIRNGLRGTVCDDDWDDKDAAVVCRKLGFMYGGQALNSSFFGPGTGPIWLDNVNCSGTEVSLEHCPHPGWAKHNCRHGEDAGVKCFDRPTQQTPPLTMRTTRTTTITTQMTQNTSPTPSTALLQIKLVGGRDASEGNVEVIINNVKFRVCDDYWDNKEAVVICKVLGYSAGGVATHNSFFGSDPIDIIFDDVNCDGTETNFGHCRAIVGVKKHDCTQNELAGVVCVKDSTSTKEPGSTLTNETIITGTCGRRPYDHVDFGKLRNKRDNPFTTMLPDIPKHLEKFHQTKIVGGSYAQHGAYPWQVRVQQVFSRNAEGAPVNVGHHCGAVIISEFWLLSAAHCFLQRRKNEFDMIVGDHSTKLKDVGEQTFSVEDIILHDQHNSDFKYNDIALIKIKPTKEGHGIKFNDYVQPACLPHSRTPFVEGAECWISGWGNVYPSGSTSAYPDILKAAVVPLVSQKQCEQLFKDIPVYGLQRMFCAGYIKGGVDTCYGDSGGPLVCKIADSYTVVGITSWGRGCALPKLPGIYTRVSAFAQWIDEKIKLHSKNNAERTFPSKP